MTIEARGHLLLAMPALLHIFPWSNPVLADGGLPHGSALLHSAIVVPELEYEETIVLCDGSAIDLIDGALV